MHEDGLTRREVIGTAAALVATHPFVASARSGGRARSWRDFTIINGNLVAPLDDEHRLGDALTGQVRASGLSALKLTIGGTAGGLADTQSAITSLDRAIASNLETYVKVANVHDLDMAKRTGRVGLIYSFEAATMLEGDPANVGRFAVRGVRVLGPSYNTSSPFASGVMGGTRRQGLTRLGHDAIAEMNRHRVTLDLSHTDEPSSLAAITASGKPVAVTHAGCSAVHPHPRNKSDRLLRGLSDRGGVVGIYELCFISAGPAQQSLADYMAHMLHALRVCGEDHVGIGSDAPLTAFDTSSASTAEWNKDILGRKAAGVAAPGEGRHPFVAGLNRPDRVFVIADELARRRVPTRIIEKVLGGNFRSVFAETCEERDPWTPSHRTPARFRRAHRRSVRNPLDYGTASCDDPSGSISYAPTI